MRLRWWAVVAVLVPAVGALAACNGGRLGAATVPATAATATAARDSVAVIEVAGSTTMAPVVALLATAYHAEGGPVVNVNGTGSADGVTAVLRGTADIGMVSRRLAASEQRHLQAVTIGYDTVSVVVNSHNPVASVSPAVVAAVFQRQYSDWSQITTAVAGPIVAVSREPGSGTRAEFERQLTISGRLGHGVIETEGNRGVIAAVARNPSAVGYVSAVALPDRVRVVAAVAARPMVLVYDDARSPAVGDFLRWLDQSQSARRILAHHWRQP